jgi:hypothetical protein
VTGNDWKEWFDGADQTPKAAMCFGFFSGSLDRIRLMQKTTGAIIVCDVPQGACTILEAGRA